jgi:head-tail adaptor
MQVSKLSHRIVFENRTPGADDYGNTLTDDWGNQKSVWALLNIWGVPNIWDLNDDTGSIWCAYRPQYGREILTAGRNDGGIEGVLTMRYFAKHTLLTTGARARFVSGPNAGKIMNIRNVIPMDDRQWIEIVAEEYK